MKYNLIIIYFVIDDCNQTNLVSKPYENNCKNMLVDDSNITNLTKNKCISKVVKKSHKESFEKNTFEGN